MGFKKILNIAKKIFLVVAVYFIVISLFVYFINKDKPKITQDPIKKNREEIYKVINDPILNKTNEGKLTIAIYRTMLCGMIGEACTDNPEDGEKNFNHSLFGFISNLIVLPYANPPASGVYWAYSGLQNAGFIPKTYAAEGIGFAAIRPLMAVWKEFRNISYMLLVLVLIAIGFMIMFRMKLNPQTIISIENALPKIVAISILITFSFPIGGFMIDLMYIIIAIIASVIIQAGGQNLSLDDALNPSFTRIFSFLWGGNFFNIFRIPVELFHLFEYLGIIVGIIISWLFGAFVVFPLLAPITAHIKGAAPRLEAQPVGIGASFDLLRTALGSTVAWITAFLSTIVGGPIILFILLGLVIALTIIFLFLRIIFLLLGSYIKIIILILFSPLIILFGSLPSSPFNFESWFKNLLGELLTFPLTIALFMIGGIITQVTKTSSALFTPPFLFSLNQNALNFLIGAALMFLTPDLVKTFKQVILPKPLPLPEIGPTLFFTGGKTAIDVGIGEISKWGAVGSYFGPAQKILSKIGFSFNKGQEPKKS